MEIDFVRLTRKHPNAMERIFKDVDDYVHNCSHYEFT